jgi:two-component system sensor histidine kinase BaeS
MNRLWVWISAIIVGVILFVAIFPFGYRIVTGKPFGAPAQPEDIPFDQGTPERFREQAERRIWDNLARMIAIGAVIGLIAGVLLARWIVLPLRQLEDGARAISRRDLDYRVPVKGSVEMRSVAMSFNQMSEDIQRQEILRRNMLADVTHELRHPVHILQGNLQAVMDGVYPLNLEEIERLLDQTQNLTTLVDDLYELALAEAHELPLHKLETDLVKLIQNVTELFQSLADDKTIKLVVEVPEESMYAQLDPDRIRQALGNLLGNAFRYTPSGGEIEVTLFQKLDQYLIRVRDTGTGMAHEELSKVFDRFYRGDTSRKRDLPGTGLGLPIAQAVVLAHGGHISVDSDGVGYGSTFTIHLPIL